MGLSRYPTRESASSCKEFRSFLSSTPNRGVLRHDAGQSRSHILDGGSISLIADSSDLYHCAGRRSLMMHVVTVCRRSHGRRFASEARNVASQPSDPPGMVSQQLVKVATQRQGSGTQYPCAPLLV